MALVAATFVYLGFNLFKSSTKTLPGQEVPDKGRNHVTDIYGIEYSSNPPSSGPHFPVWAKPGIYDRFISNGYLIHSMEHGYIVIWYDCDKKLSIFNSQFSIEALAHDEPVEESTDSGQLLMHMKIQPTGNMSWFTPQNPSEEEIPLPDSFKTDSCKKLVSDLSQFTKVAQRVVVVPKQNLDSLIALTAWGRIDKLNDFDDARIEEFIKAYHNRGPEQTVE